MLCLSTGAGAATFPEVYNSEPDKTAQPMPPQAALAALHVPEGFKAELFAAEPEVQNPVALAWDHRGRLWVAENYTYAERAKRFDLAMKDRVIILEDKDGDGKAESRKVFTDNVQMLTSVEVGRGGVWLMCPPQVLFVPDADGDDVPDGPPQPVLDGFTVAKDNYHNFANGLRWGPDGWLYGRCGHSCPGQLGVPGTPEDKRVPIKGGLWRFHPERKVVEVISHGTTNPWGHDWDRHGELFFINTVQGHLWQAIPGAHLGEGSGNSINRNVYQRMDMIADHWHFDTSGSWQDSRDGKANSLGGGHAHIGMMIYQGGRWPERFNQKLFTLNMHGRRANVERLEPKGSSYVGRHEPDVFLSDDPWFRGIEISTGPDGNAWILDWSDTGECHESTGVHRTSGRIFKVSHGDKVTPDLSDLEKLSAEGAMRLIRHTNVWYSRQLNERLKDAVQRKVDVSAIQEALSQALMVEKDAPQKLRILWALNAIAPLKEEALVSLLEDSSPYVRSWSIRLLNEGWPTDDILSRRHGEETTNTAVLQRLLKLAETEKEAQMRLTLASTLQRLPLALRADWAKALVAHAEDAEDYALPSLVWYGLVPVGTEKPEALVEVAKAAQWPQLLRWVTRNLASQMEKKPAPLESLLVAFSAGEIKPAFREAVITGLGEAFQGWRKAPKPASWDAFAAAFQSSTPEWQGKVRDLSTLFGDGRALDEIKAMALNEKADMGLRQSALKTLIDNRPDDLRAICEKLLFAKGMSSMAVRGLALFDDAAIGTQLAEQYRKFPAGDRQAVLETLVARPIFATALLKQMEKGKIARTDLTAFHARQILAFKNDELAKQLKDVWGELRDSAADKKELIENLKKTLTSETLAKADLSKGRMLFQAICASCHKMYGEGGLIGPDLTGSGRSNLDYLLENIADPSGVVSADYRMSVVTLKDGRVLSGVISGKTDRTLSLRSLTETLTVDLSEVVKQDTSTTSMMPEGLLLAFQPDQVRDLIAYLMHPSQVPMPGAQ